MNIFVQSVFVIVFGRVDLYISQNSFSDTATQRCENAYNKIL